MFNWLRRNKERTLQVADELQRGLRQAFLRSNDEFASQAAAEEIVDAFTAVLARSSDYILDERKLPYPKEVIRLAFLKRISFCRERSSKDPDNSEWKRDLGLHEAVEVHIADFQAIDPGDEDVVRAANEWNNRFVLEVSKFQTPDQKNEYIARAIKSDGRIVSEWQPLFQKYLRRSMNENGITPIGENTQRIETLRTRTVEPYADKSSQ